MGRSLFLARLLLLLWGLGSLVSALWWLSAAPGTSWHWLGLLAWAGTSLGLWLGWRHTPGGQLRWDGQAWTWQSQGYASPVLVAAPQIVLDLQRLLLIRMYNGAGASWLVWADAAHAPGQWLDLRRALVALPHNAGVASDAAHPTQP